MSRFLWSSLLISPAVLGATLVVSASAMAADSQKAADALKPQAEQAQSSETQLDVLASATLEAPAATAAAPAVNSDAIATNSASEVSTPSVAEQASALQLQAPANSAQPESANTVESVAVNSTQPEAVSSVKPEDLAPAVAEQAQQAAPKQPETVAQTAAPATENPASTLEQLNRYSSEGAGNTDAQGQVTSVSQLSDVQPTDWAFQALQSLVERYGCIAGYPDGTYRGNRAMTRYEFAAGLNACLERVNELITAGTSNLVTREDLAALQRLQEEFAAELATLRGRVDALEARTAELEANQFSTTTKLTGEAIFAVSDDFGGRKLGFVRLGGQNRQRANETVFQQRVRLNLNTSFTGRDLLLTRLQVGNGQTFNFGYTKQGNQTWQNVAAADNVFRLDSLLYKFPLSNRLNVTLAANNATWDDIIPTVNPYFEDFDGGNGSLSSFGQRNPIYRLGGGAGIGFDYAFGGRGLLGGVFGPTSLSFGYLASTASNPSRGQGLFNGDYSAMVQLTFTPSRNLQFAVNYNHAYFQKGNFGFDNGLASGPDTVGGFTGTGYANSIGDTGFFEDPYSRARAVSSNSYGAQLSWRLSPNIVIGGWGALTHARLLGLTNARIWNYAATLAFPDLGKEGNLLGFIAGREPYIDRIKGNSFFLNPSARKTSWHFEAFYKFQLTDNISVTPGVIWITRPNQTRDDKDIVIGTLRTTFTF
ncbi:MAG: iron uptake porin [Actinomycetota bacterium]